MDFHAFMYVTISRRHELERGMAGKDPVLYQRMLDEIAGTRGRATRRAGRGSASPSITSRWRASSWARTRA